MREPEIEGFAQHAFESTGDVLEGHDPEVLPLPTEQHPVTGKMTARILEVRAATSDSDIIVASFTDSRRRVPQAGILFLRQVVDGFGMFIVLQHPSLSSTGSLSLFGNGYPFPILRKCLCNRVSGQLGINCNCVKGMRHAGTFFSSGQDHGHYKFCWMDRRRC